MPPASVPARLLVADLQRLPDDLAGVLVGIGDDDQRGGRVGDEPAQPGRERVAQRDGQRARDVPGGVVGDRAHVDDLAAVGQQRPDLRPGSAGRARGADARTAGPRRFCSGSRRKYGGKLPRPASSAVTNASSSPAASSGLAARLPPDRGGALRAGRGGAERPRAVRRPHRRSRRAGSAAAAGRRTGPGPAARSAPGRTGRCGPPHPTSSDPPVNTPSTCAAVEQQEREVLVGVARACPAPAASARPGPPRRRRPAPVARTPGRPAADASTCAPSSAASCGAPDRKSACRCVSAANATRSPRRRGGRPHRPQVPRHIDHQRPAVAQVHQVGRVAQPLVHHGHDHRSSHSYPLPAPAPAATGRPARFHSGKPSIRRRA